MKTLQLVGGLLVALIGASASGQSLAVPSCSYVPGYVSGSQPQIGPPAPPLTDWEVTLVTYFNRQYGSVLPPLPFLTLYNEANARAGGFGVALNRLWLNSMGVPMGTAVVAHELGHVCQAYNLLPIDQAYMGYGLEGQADYFAGRLLRASGFPQDAFENAVLPIVVQSQPSATHPPGPARVMLMRAGYYHQQ